MGARVLDLGCGPGRLAELLAGRGCTVVGIDVDPDALEAAANWCEQVVLADIDEAAARPETGEPFDAVCLLDVLEHLRQPEEVLRWAAKLLRPDGVIVVSLPNVAHAAVKLQLMSGHFERTDSGLLDRTHLHLYDRASAESLLLDAGLEVIEHLRVRRAIDETEISLDLGIIPSSVLDEALRDPDALTYQFFFVATVALRAETASPLALQLQGRLERSNGALAEAASYARHLEGELAAKGDRLDALELSTADAQQRAAAAERLAGELRDVIVERMAELHALAAEQRALTAELTIKESYSLRMRAEIADREAQLVAAATHAHALDVALAAGLAEVDRLRRHEAWAHELHDLLAEERRRASYRLTQRLHAALGPMIGAQTIVRWVARRMASR